MGPAAAWIGDMEKGKRGGEIEYISALDLPRPPKRKCVLFSASI